ncbi:MAG: hypothetical protein JWQ30_1967, partial [Sediminibacterium sp.]|nr:hypothetical protein [Sediminibacterium sp.]
MGDVKNLVSTEAVDVAEGRQQYR